MIHTYVYIPGFTYTSKGPLHIDAIRLEATTSDGLLIPTYIKIIGESKEAGSVIYKSFSLRSDFNGWDKSISEGVDLDQYSNVSDLTPSNIKTPLRLPYGRFLDTLVLDLESKKYNHIISYGIDTDLCQKVSMNKSGEFHDGLFVLSLDNLNTDIHLNFTFYSRITYDSSNKLVAGEEETSSSLSIYSRTESDLFANGYIVIDKKEEVYNPVTSGVVETEDNKYICDEYKQLYYDISKGDSFEFELPMNGGFLVARSNPSDPTKSTRTNHGKKFYYQYTYDNDTKKHILDPTLTCNTSEYLDSLYSLNPDHFTGLYYNKFYSQYNTVSSITAELCSISQILEYYSSGGWWKEEYGLWDTFNHWYYYNGFGTLVFNHFADVYQKLGIAVFNTILKNININLIYKYTRCNLLYLNYLYKTSPSVTIKNLSFTPLFSNRETVSSSNIIGSLVFTNRLSRFPNAYTKTTENYGSGKHETYEYNLQVDANGYWKSWEGVNSPNIGHYPQLYQYFSSLYSLYWANQNQMVIWRDTTDDNNTGKISDLYRKVDSSIFSIMPSIKYNLDIAIDENYAGKFNCLSSGLQYNPGRNLKIEYVNLWDLNVTSKIDYSSGLRVDTAYANNDLENNTNSDLFLNLTELINSYTTKSNLGTDYSTTSTPYMPPLNSMIWYPLPIFSSKYTGSDLLKLASATSILEPNSSSIYNIPLTATPSLKIDFHINEILFPSYYCVDKNNTDKKPSPSRLLTQMQADVENGYLSPSLVLSLQFVIDLDKSNVKYKNTSDYKVVPLIKNLKLGYENDTAQIVNIDCTKNYLCNSGEDSVTNINSTVTSILKVPTELKVKTGVTLNPTNPTSVYLNQNSSFCNDRRFISTVDAPSNADSEEVITINKTLQSLETLPTLYVMSMTSYVGNPEFKVNLNIGSKQMEYSSTNALLLLYLDSTKQVTINSITPRRSTEVTYSGRTQLFQSTRLDSYIGAIGIYKVDLSIDTLVSDKINAYLKDLNPYIISDNDSNVLTQIIKEKLITLPSAFCLKEKLVFLADLSSLGVNNKYSVKKASALLEYYFNYLPKEAYYRIDGFYTSGNTKYIEGITLTDYSGYTSVDNVQSKLNSYKIKEDVNID